VRPNSSSLEPETINAVRIVKDHLRSHAQGVAANMAIAPPLLKSARTAYSRYKENLEKEWNQEETRKREMLARKQTLGEESNRQKEQEEKRRLERKTSAKLYEERMK